MLVLDGHLYSVLIFVMLQRFAAVIMRIREPKTTALIFASGKMVCSFLHRLLVIKVHYILIVLKVCDVHYIVFLKSL